MKDENKEKDNDNMRLKSKPRFEGLDGLRGVAAITVVIFHIFEIFSGDPAHQIINHGYLAVDFFYVLSGFVLGYAYDDRWNKMSYWGFYKRRLIRLHPMVIAGSLLGMCYFF
jgi:peptidoglycan/LPS O-acetylase OafA/YrhL